MGPPIAREPTKTGASMCRGSATRRGFRIPERGNPQGRLHVAKCARLQRQIFTYSYGEITLRFAFGGLEKVPVADW